MFTINFKKKPNAPHQDFHFCGLFREFFFVIIVNMKVKYMLT